MFYQYQLGQMYETGQDGLVPLDIEAARKLYVTAAGFGVKEAGDRLKVIGLPIAPPPLAAP